MSFKRALSLLLSVILTAGSMTSFAVEDISVSEVPTISVSPEETSDMPTQVTAKTETAANDVIFQKSSRNQTFSFGTPISFDVTVKHPKNASAGRAVVKISGDDDSVTKTFSKNATSSFTFHAVLQNKEASLEYPYAAGKYTVHAYIETKKQGTWVRTSSIKTTNLYITPSVQVDPSVNLNTMQESLLFHFSFYNHGDDEDSNYPEDYFNAKVYRKTSQETEWTQVPFNIWTEYHLVNTYYEDTNVKNGKKYTYSVKTALDGHWSKRSKSISYYFLYRPKKFSLVNHKSDTTVSLSWSQNSKATGYEVQYLTKPFTYSNEHKAKKRDLSGNRNSSLTLKNRTAGKQYYFRVRGYKTVNNKRYYSAWSDTIQRYGT